MTDGDSRPLTTFTEILTYGTLPDSNDSLVTKLQHKTRYMITSSTYWHTHTNWHIVSVISLHDQNRQRDSHALDLSSWLEKNDKWQLYYHFIDWLQTSTFHAVWQFYDIIIMSTTTVSTKRDRFDLDWIIIHTGLDLEWPALSHQVNKMLDLLRDLLTVIFDDWATYLSSIYCYLFIIYFHVTTLM